MATLAERFAGFACGLELDAVPAAVVADARLHLLDALGCGLAASALGEGTPVRDALTAAPSRGSSSVIGSEHRLPAADAALANGTLCHGLDFDDTHAAAIAHVTTVVAPAALGAAEEVGADGATVLAALIAGNEVMARVGVLAAPSYGTRGFHPTSVCGIFGAVAAVARVRGVDAATAVNAFGIAASFAGGVMEYLADGSSTKPLHAGWAAHGGLLAVAFAQAGATGPATALEGRFGLLRAFFEQTATEAAPLPADGGAWETSRIAFKPYPACHLVHTCVDAALELRALHGVDPSEIEAVELAVVPPAVEVVLEPAAAKAAPRTPYEARFSLPYSVAAALVRGRVGLLDYVPEAIVDPEVLELAARIGYEVRAFPTYPGAFPGGVTLRLRDARVLEHAVLNERGGPEQPIPAGEIVAKFRANAGLALAAGDVEVLEASLLALEEHGDLETVLSPLTRARPLATALR